MFGSSLLLDYCNTLYIHIYINYYIYLVITIIIYKSIVFQKFLAKQNSVSGHSKVILSIIVIFLYKTLKEKT